MRQVYQNFSAIVTAVGNELGLNLKQQDVLGSNDRDTSQIANLVIETCEELLTRYPWRTVIGTNPWVLTVTQTYTYTLVADTDTPFMDSRIVKLGAKWRYMNVKGLDYGEMFKAYEVRINAFAADMNKDNVVNENVASTVAF